MMNFELAIDKRFGLQLWVRRAQAYIKLYQFKSQKAYTTAGKVLVFHSIEFVKIYHFLNIGYSLQNLQLRLVII